MGNKRYLVLQDHLLAREDNPDEEPNVFWVINGAWQGIYDPEDNTFRVDTEHHGGGTEPARRFGPCEIFEDYETAKAAFRKNETEAIHARRKQPSRVDENGVHH